MSLVCEVLLENIRYMINIDNKKSYIFLLRCLIRTNINTPDVILAQWQFTLIHSSIGLDVIFGYELELFTSTIVHTNQGPSRLCQSYMFCQVFQKLYEIKKKIVCVGYVPHLL